MVRGRRDEGAATVVVVAVAAALSVICGVLAVVGSATIQRQRAQGAADLAALAAAGEIWSGRDVACARSRAVAAENGAHVLACDVAGGSVFITVGRSTSALVAHLAVPEVRASSHAGVVPPDHS